MRSHTARETALRRLRELLESGLQARDVATRARLNEVTISNWKLEKESFNPTLETLEKLAHGLGISVAELVGEAPTFEEHLRAMKADEKLALVERLLAEARRDRG